MIRQRSDPDGYLEDFEEHRSEREFFSIKNLDAFLSNIYEYHRGGGFYPIVYSKISNLIIIAFTIAFSVLLVGFVNWHSVLNCGNDDRCKHVELIENKIVKNRTFGFVVVIYTMVFVLYLLWHFANFVYSLSSLKETQRFYHEKLKINDAMIRRTPWSEVMDRMVSVQRSVRLYHNKQLDALDITNRIMRKENYMIAMVNKGVLQFTTPSLSEKLCWTLRSENRRNTNADVLRTDPAALAKTAAKPRRKRLMMDTLRLKSFFKKELQDPLCQSTNRHLLPSQSEPMELRKEKAVRLKEIKTKIQKTLKEQKQRLKMKDKRRGYLHVGIGQEAVDHGDGAVSDGDSDVSEESEVMDGGIGHEYPQGKIRNVAKADPNFADDFWREKMAANETEDTLDRMGRIETSKGYLGNILEWNVRYVVFQSMFDESMKIRDSFKTNSNKLKWKFFWFGVGNLLLTPFTLAFRIIFFFLENAEEMQSNKGHLFSFRQWTTLAKLKFREFNELPHAFDLRMAMTAGPATDYIDSFPKPPHVLILSELVSYISGSIVGVLLLLFGISPEIQLLGRSLVWFLAIFSAILAIARANMVYNDPGTEYEEKMNEIGRCTHYLPAHWQGRCHSQRVRNQFMNLYQPKVVLFISELVNVFSTPLILMFTLPNCVDRLLEFVEEYSDHIDGVGDICSFSRFDFQRFETKLMTHNGPHSPIENENENENENGNDVECKQSEAEMGLLSPMSSMPRNISSTSNVSAVSNLSSMSSDVQQHARRPKEQPLDDNKLESGLLTFCINHPHWKVNKEQSAVLRSIAGMGPSMKATCSASGTSTPKRVPQHFSSNSNMNMKHLAVPSASTAQLCLTFSELLKSQYEVGVHQSESMMRYSGLSVNKIPNPPILSNSLLFCSLQRSHHGQNSTFHHGPLSLTHSNSQPQSLHSAQSSLQSSSPRQSLHLFGGHQHMMLSEINESDSSPKRPGPQSIRNRSDEENDDDSAVYDPIEEDEKASSLATYQTLAMQSSIDALNVRDDTFSPEEAER